MSCRVEWDVNGMRVGKRVNCVSGVSRVVLELI